MNQFGRICNAAAQSIRIYNPKHDFIALQMLILTAVELQIRLNSKTLNYELWTQFGRICNAAGKSVRICNPKHDFFALQMLILTAVELQIRLNSKLWTMNYEPCSGAFVMRPHRVSGFVIRNMIFSHCKCLYSRQSNCKFDWTLNS